MCALLCGRQRRQPTAGCVLQESVMNSLPIHGQRTPQDGAQVYYLKCSEPNLCCEDPIATARAACASPHDDGRYHVPRAGAAAVTAPGTIGEAKLERRLCLPSFHLEAVHRA